MNRKRRGGFSILAAVLAVMFALFLGLLFWLLHGNAEPERILQGAEDLGEAWGMQGWGMLHASRALM